MRNRISTSHTRVTRRANAMHRVTAALLVALFVPALACAEGPAKATIEADELASRIADGSAPLILDVRSQGEFAAGHIPGAILIPHDALADRLAELPADKTTEIVVHCQSGRRAGMAEKVLAENGYSHVRDLVGHWKEWSAAGRPIDKPES